MSDTVIIALIGGTAGIITAVGTVLFRVYDIVQKKKQISFSEEVREVVREELKPAEERLDDIKRDVTRMRLLDLIRYESGDAENILTIGKLYFDGYHGNSEASKQFARWLKQEKIKKPEWFNLEGGK